MCTVCQIKKVIATKEDIQQLRPRPHIDLTAFLVVNDKRSKHELRLRFGEGLSEDRQQLPGQADLHVLMRGQ